MRSSLLLAALGLSAVASPQEPPATRRVETVERIVAVVDERPLLLSEVKAFAALKDLGLPEATRGAIDERLMYAQASQLAQAEVRRDEEDRALAALRARPQPLRNEPPEPELRRLLRRQLAILKYVEFRFRPQVRVSDEQVRAAWEADEVGRPAGQALEDAQEAIRERLERRALDQRVEAWVAELRSRVVVRYVPD